MKTILVRPNCSEGYYKDLQNLRAIEPPLWHLILAKYYKADEVIDAEAKNYNYLQTIEQILKSKAQRIIILATGSHPSANIQQTDIANKIANFIRSISKNYQVEVYNYLPVNPIHYKGPNWDLVDVKDYVSHNWQGWAVNGIRQYYGAIYTSISCPYSCKFCQIKNFYRRNYEQRPLDDVFTDFDQLAKLQVKNIKVLDELFILNPKRVELICDYLISRGYNFNIWAYARIDTISEKLLKKLKKAGFNWLAIGVEAGNEEIRRKILKGKFTNDKIREVVKVIHDNGIYIVGNYMFGFWEEKLEHLQETLAFAQELNCEYSNFYCVSAFPKTPLYDFYKKQNIDLPQKSIEYAQMSYHFKPLPTKYLSAKEVLKFRDEAFEIYFTDPYYLGTMDLLFGEKVIREIINMTKIKIKRKILEDGMEY